jgi:predicted CoA-substrate-specific enzyme activase
MGWFIGIDIGSAYSKGVITRDSELVASHVRMSGADYGTSAEVIRAQLLEQVNLDAGDVANTVATGVGADHVHPASQKASDIVCTARGMNSTFPQARTAIDVGSQSSRVIHLSGKGKVVGFTVSEKCAAGSGRFIEVIANVLRIELSDFSPLSARSKTPITFSTGCAVFGESEAITRISEGVQKEDIAAGVNRALAGKISSLVKKIRLEEPCAICGGGALSNALVNTIEDELDTTLLVPINPQLITALGAALIAATSEASRVEHRS